MVFTSALTGDGVDKIIPAAMKAGDSWRASFQTAHAQSNSGRGDRRDGPAAWSSGGGSS